MDIGQPDGGNDRLTERIGYRSDNRHCTDHLFTWRRVYRDDLGDDQPDTVGDHWTIIIVYRCNNNIDRWNRRRNMDFGNFGDSNNRINEWLSNRYCGWYDNDHVHTADRMHRDAANDREPAASGYLRPHASVHWGNSHTFRRNAGRRVGIDVANSCHDRKHDGGGERDRFRDFTNQLFGRRVFDIDHTYG